MSTLEFDPEVFAAVFPPPRRVAVIGLSDNPDRPSYGVASALKQRGYEILPVNPRSTEVMGLPAYVSLADIPGPVDVVDVFRRSDQVAEHLDDILAKKPRVLWLQEGIRNDQVALRAREAGILVVQDDCMMRRVMGWEIERAAG